MPEDGFKSDTAHDLFVLGGSISFLYVRVLLYIAFVLQQHRNRVSRLCIGAFKKNPLSLPRKSLQHNVCLFVLFVVAVGNLKVHTRTTRTTLDLSATIRA